MKKIKLYRSVAIEFIEAIAKNLPDFQYSAADASSETADMPSSVSLINNINGSCLFKFSQIINMKYTVLQTEYEKSDLLQIIIKQLPLELQQINILFLGTELYMPLIPPTSRDALISELYYLIGIDNIDFPEYLIVLRQLLNNPHFDIVNFSTSLGPTPIVYAMTKKNYQVIDILLEYIVNVDAKSEGETPLCHAAYMGHNTVFQKLLAKKGSLHEKRVSLDIYDCKGRSILYIGKRSGKHTLAVIR